MRIVFLISVIYAFSAAVASGQSLAASAPRFASQSQGERDVIFQRAQTTPNNPGRRGGGGGRGGGGASLGLGVAIPLIMDGLSKQDRQPRKPGANASRDPEHPAPKRKNKPKLRVVVTHPPKVAGEAKPPPARAAPPVTPRVIAVVDETPHRKREILILINAAAEDDVRIGIMRDYNVLADTGRRIALLDGQLLKLRLPDNRDLEQVIARLAADPRVIAANLNYIYALMTDKPSSPSRKAAAPKSLPYNLHAINVVAAHRLAQGRDVTVAVVDTCIDATHAELKGAVAEAFDATGYPNAACSAHEAHGTSMAGIIAARGELQGVAPKSRILAAKAFTPTAPGKPAEATTESLVAAIDWAYGRRAQIFNLSFAGPSDPLLRRLFQRASAKGVIFVAAAGNAGPNSPPLYPAAYEGVIAVTATGPSNALFDQANRGAYIGVAAPGVDILAPKPGGGYDISSGTSGAAAHVSGILALMLERKPGAAIGDLRAILTATAHDLGPEGNDEQFGAGLANAEAALISLDNAPETAAVVSE